MFSTAVYDTSCSRDYESTLTIQMKGLGLGNSILIPGGGTPI